ncbi:Protein of unknown function [Gryllus bimaculatus]|nr:Protein of unknown function [Gryllus bimaculatus]
MEPHQGNQIPLSGSESVDNKRGNATSSSSISKRRKKRKGKAKKYNKFTAIAGCKVYAEFPRWSPAFIRLMLDFMHNGQTCPKLTRRIEKVPVEERQSLWDELVSKLEPPTFRNVLDYIKRFLKINTRNNEVLEPPKFRIPLCNHCGFLNIHNGQNVVICFRCKRKLPSPEMA